MAHIHPSALVDSAARLADDVNIGAFTIIGPHVEIGAGTSIGSHCVIEGHTTIGAFFRTVPLAGSHKIKNTRASLRALKLAVATRFASFAPSTLALCKTAAAHALVTITGLCLACILRMTCKWAAKPFWLAMWVWLAMCILATGPLLAGNRAYTSFAAWGRTP